MSTYWGNRDIDNKTEWGLRDGYVSPTKGIGVIDSRHHLKDDTPIYFGYDSDYSLKFVSTSSEFRLQSTAASTSSSFFSIYNKEDLIFNVTYDGALAVRNIGALPTPSSTCMIIGHGNELYMSVS
jgi:hypothetical protein